MIADWLGLSDPQAFLLVVICFGAGVVRGFSGFALSALVMASAALILPPVELIPVAWWLEVSASLLMLRSGWRDADKKIVTGLLMGALIGYPIGLSLTVSLPVDGSRMIAFLLIMSLALAQLARLNIAALATIPGILITGICAGTATGLAGVGGMVIALFVLAMDKSARQMRASLMLYMLLGSVLSFGYHLWFGTMTWQATYRGWILILPTLIGVGVGMALFTPRLEKYYRPFCLSLLMMLALFGVIRLLL